MAAPSACRTQSVLYKCYVVKVALKAPTHGCHMQGLEFTALSKAKGVWNVKHPVLDKVRRCSAEPEEAAKFFAMVLFPGIKRPSAFVAQRMPYLKKLRQELTDYNNSNPHQTGKPTCIWPCLSPPACPLLVTLPVSSGTSC